MFSLYIHIPFCVRKCRYCDFLSGPYGEDMREAYVKALVAELRRESLFYRNREVETIFFGGGTPSLLTEEQLTRIMHTIYNCFRVARQAEISLEMNPGTVTKEKLKTMGVLGINRLSIGLQSASDELLRQLGRIHTWAQFEECYGLARQQGFDNINIDVMSALPGQSLEVYEETLHKVLELEPEHISAYSLILEEGTWFWEHQKELDFVGEDLDRQMYGRTKELLAKKGYIRYEISNYARPGYACQHNLAYWRRTDYVGFGIGAASFVEGVRYRNTGQIKAYLTQKSPKNQIEPLSVQDAMEEFMFLGLRCMEGVYAQEFEKQFGRSLQDVYGEAIDALKQEGLLSVSHDEKAENSRVFLTERGIDLSNYVFEKFLF